MMVFISQLHLPAPSPRSGGERVGVRGNASPLIGAFQTKSQTRGLVLVSTALILATQPSPANAQSVADFYRGKTIEIIVAAAAAGGYDLASRTVANHMSRHVPGNPKFVIRNMPGATGLIGTNYLYNVAKRDGTVIGMPTSNVPLEPRLKFLSTDGSAVKFDFARFSWIGTPMQEPQVTWVWHTAPANNFEDLKTHEIVMGATANSADNYVLPTLANALLGTRMKPLTGYVGQNEIDIAAERGEVHGNNTSLSNLTVGRANWVRDRKIRILLQWGNERLAAIKEVPTVAELTTAQEDRDMLRFYALKFTMTRPLIIPPEVPSERVAALQRAFADTMRDSQYLDDARRIGLDVNWLGSEEMMQQARLIKDTPQPAVDRLRDLLARAAAK
jgi:tripartite-type tricarboxylate transporter receptor subunit TctC